MSIAAIIAIGYIVVVNILATRQWLELRAARRKLEAIEREAPLANIFATVEDANMVINERNSLRDQLHKAEYERRDYQFSVGNVYADLRIANNEAERLRLENDVLVERLQSSASAKVLGGAK